jgi:hypothetical protein
MGAMRKAAQHTQEIIVEWRCPAVGGECGSGCLPLAMNELLSVARALGRLAAKRDLTRAQHDVAPERLSSDQNDATIEVEELA